MKSVLIKIGILHFLWAALGYAALLHFDIELSIISYTWGAAFIGTQVIFLMILGYRIIYKKGIALTLLISVFKYGILLGIFVLSAAGFLRITPGFAIGCLSIIPSLTSLILLRPILLKEIE